MPYYDPVGSVAIETNVKHTFTVLDAFQCPRCAFQFVFLNGVSVLPFNGANTCSSCLLEGSLRATILDCKTSLAFSSSHPTQ